MLLETTAMEIVLAKCVEDILMSINKLSYPCENSIGVMLEKVIDFSNCTSIISYFINL